MPIIWPASIDPMSFERENTKIDGEMFREILLKESQKTTELFIFSIRQKTQKLLKILWITF